MIHNRYVQTFLLFAAQVLIFNHVHFGIYGIPLLLPLYVVWAPIGSGRIWLMVSACLLGFANDIYAGTLGVGMLSMTTIAMMQDSAARHFITKDTEERLTPHWKTMHFREYFLYMCLLLTVHHVLFFILEDFSYAHIQDTILAILSSLAISLPIALLADYGRGKGL